MPGRHHQNPRLAKSYRCYSVNDIVDLYGVHQNTVRNWVAAGLRPIDDRHEMLFNGRALNDFHASRRSKAKRPCGPAQVYCLGCRAPRTPVPGLIDTVSAQDQGAVVEVLCPDGHLIRQWVSAARLNALRSLIEGSPSPLRETP